jgi:acetoacetyl-CoA synthetase
MLQCRSLGMDVRALPSEETPADSAVGELVCANPFPSRPLGLLGDADGSRFHAAYFAQNEGLWTHGDLIEFDADGQARIHGRSDGILNIQAVRIGPSEIYQALGGVPEIAGAMAVEQRHDAGSRLVLLVVLREGAELDAELVLRVRRTIGAATTALHVPQLVVAVEELPVTHSGKLSEKAGRAAVEGREAANRRALANPDSLDRIRAAVIAAEAARARAEAVEPDPGAPTLERVRAIWEAVLGVEGLRPDDDFFVLGGTSLQAVRVFTLIRERIGPDLPLSILIDAPTLAELTAVVKAPARRLETVVQIRAGAGAPLYFTHSIWGDVIEMRQVATAMRAGVPIFGLRARGLAPGEERQESVEEMAETYVEAILDRHPGGPFRIAGYSFGGLLAYEIACRLAARGEEVGWLGLIDAELSAACLPPALRWRRRAAVPFHVARAALADPAAAVRAARTDVLPKLVRPRGGELQREAAFADSHAAWMDEASPTHQRIATAFLEVAATYRPGPYPGRLTYFLPEVRRLHLYPDPLPVWRRLVAGGVEVVPVPGPHVGMVSGEAAQVVARRIDTALSP